MVKFLSVVVSVILMLVMAGCGSKYTMEKYDKIELEMTYDQVMKIMDSEAKADNVSENKSSVSERVVTWAEPQAEISYITVTFGDGKVIAKTVNAIGDDEPTKWTSKKTENLDKGMTYAEVRKIVAYSPSQDTLSKSADGQSYRVSKWVNNNGSCMTLGFKDDLYIHFKTRN